MSYKLSYQDPLLAPPPHQRSPPLTLPMLSAVTQHDLGSPSHPSLASTFPPAHHRPALWSTLVKFHLLFHTRRKPHAPCERLLNVSEKDNSSALQTTACASWLHAFLTWRLVSSLYFHYWLWTFRGHILISLPSSNHTALDTGEVLGTGWWRDKSTFTFPFWGDGGSSPGRRPNVRSMFGFVAPVFISWNAVTFFHIIFVFVWMVLSLESVQLNKYLLSSIKCQELRQVRRTRRIKCRT